MARLRTAGVVATAAITLLAIPASATAAPFVRVDASLQRTADGAVVTGRVVWDGAAARREPELMTEGNLRLVAIGEHGHRPTLLGTATYDRIASDPTQDVRLRIDGDAKLAAIRTGNRVVLTASQHGARSAGERTSRTYVTVGELQPFGSPQDRIGRRDCSDLPVEVGEQLNHCDLTGADLDRALVSVRQPQSTRMLLADLTGATLRTADLTGLSVAGGRLNGADATNAILDNLSLAHVEAVGLVARGATSDRLGGTAGANVFDATLTDADFHGVLFNGVSLNHSRLNGADFSDATWNAVNADTANLRGADLTGLKGVGSTVYFTDFTDAKLLGSTLLAINLAWSTLCRTQMPDGTPAAGEDRDCRARTDDGPTRAEHPFVVVDANLKRVRDRDGERATITGIVSWSTSAIGSGVTAGDLRAVAIDGSTGLPTTIDAVTIAADLPPTTRYAATITDPRLLAALDRGNRVVLTATQHPPRPSPSTVKTVGSYVTVDTLAPGPGRGRVGSRDCSDVVLSATTPSPGGYDLCDLPGAVLTQAGLSGPMHKADLTGAELGNAGLNGIIFDGAAMGGANLKGADFSGDSMIETFAPGLNMPKTLIRGAQLRAASLDGANFLGATISETTFAAAPLRRATFTDALFDKVDLGYADLAGAHLERVGATSDDPTRSRRSSLFLSDLTGANLKGGDWDDDEAGDRPWKWATLCNTVMPNDPGPDNTSDRDCPR